MYPDVLGTKYKKKQSVSSLQKKFTDIQADTLGMKKWENGSLIVSS